MRSDHGGDVTGFELQYGRRPVDFSASLNPMGMPPGVREAAIRAVAEAEHYPDPYGRRLTAALAGQLGVAREALILGNGAADLIHRYVQAVKPHCALLPAPSFAEYGRALAAAGCGVRQYLLRAEDGFDLDERILGEITEEIDLIFLCQPGNPTGRLIAHPLLERILERCGQTGTRVLLDECFLSFVDGGEALSLVPELEKHRGLFILGSFTKLYAMAGLRLGYGLCADGPLMEALTLSGQPWGVSTVAQAAGLAALEEGRYVARSRELIRTERAWLWERLVVLWVEVLGGAANYLFFRLPGVDLAEALAQRGYLIRDCANFPGLGEGYYRVAVRTPEENRGLIKAVEACFKGGTGQ